MTEGSARSPLYKERPTPSPQGERLVREEGWGRGETHGPAHEAPCSAVAVAGAQTSLTVRDADGGWNVLFQSKPPPAETNPSSRPLPHAQKRPPGLCLSACLGTRFFQSPGKSGPAAPLPHPSPSVLLQVRLRRLFIPRQRNRAGPRSLPRSSFALVFSPSPRSLFCVFQKENCFPCPLSPCDVMGTVRSRRSQRKQLAEPGPS